MKMLCVAALKSPAAFHGQIRSLERARVNKVLNVDPEKHSWTFMLLCAAEKNRTCKFRLVTDCSLSVLHYRLRISSSTRSAVVQREQSWSGCTSCKVLL